MTKTLNVYISKSPKNSTTPNNAKIVIRRGMEIFLKANVGSLLINKNEIKIKNVGTTILWLIFIRFISLKLNINGINTKIPPAGDGTPSK